MVSAFPTITGRLCHNVLFLEFLLHRDRWPVSYTYMLPSRGIPAHPKNIPPMDAASLFGNTKFATFLEP